MIRTNYNREHSTHRSSDYDIKKCGKLAFENFGGNMLIRITRSCASLTDDQTVVSHYYSYMMKESFDEYQGYICINKDPETYNYVCIYNFEAPNQF